MESPHSSDPPGVMGFEYSSGSGLYSFLWVQFGLDDALTLLSIVQTFLNPVEAVESCTAGFSRISGGPVVL